MPHAVGFHPQDGYSVGAFTDLNGLTTFVMCINLLAHSKQGKIRMHDEGRAEDESPPGAQPYVLP